MSTETDSPAAYNGECALAVRLGKEAPGSEGCSLEHEGRTYYFKNRLTRFAFKLMPNSFEKADEKWAERQGS